MREGEEPGHTSSIDRSERRTGQKESWGQRNQDHSRTRKGRKDLLSFV